MPDQQPATAAKLNLINQENSTLPGMGKFVRLPSPRAILIAICSTAMTMVLTGCPGGSSSSPAAAGSSPSETAPALGSIVISGRLNPASTTVNSTTASPDSVSLYLDEVAISSDDSSYQTIFTGSNTKEDFIGSDVMRPTVPAADGITAGKYKSLRVTLDHLDWNATWGFSNVSPCDGAASGTTSGSLNLSAQPTYYFKTTDLGGNTAQYYLANPPLTGYIGDADHPLALATPIQIVKNETTTLNLMINADRTLGCSRLSKYSYDTNTSTWAYSAKIDGTDTGLLGTGMFAVDTLRNEIAVASGGNSSVRIFDRGSPTASPTGTPLRIFSGPATLLNNPVGLALYHDAATPDGSGDQYIVANKDNNSIVTYSTSASDNAAPVRTITGSLVDKTGTRLDQPSGIALYHSTMSNQDEILVANSGNDTITAYTRRDFGNSDPLWLIDETADGFTQATPCGVAVDQTNKKLFVSNSSDNSIAVYNIADEANIGLDSVLKGASTDLSHPCGIAIDSTNNEVIVANTDNNKITVFDNNSSSGTYAFTNFTVNDIAPIRTISGATTGLNKPVGVQVAGNELWVSDRGNNAEMLAMPTIMPVVSNAAVANANLNGNYNIVMYGIDLSKGVNGKGAQIPVFFAGRGSVNFNSQATPWPTFAFKLDTENRRRLMAASDITPDFQTKNGYYGMDTNNHFYAALQDRKGMIDGSFLSDGSAFNGSFYYGNEIFFIYGIRKTGSTVKYFSSDGTIHGLPAHYSFVNYTDLQNMTMISPTGEAEPVQTTAATYRARSETNANSYTNHAGGQFEIGNSSASYAGMAGSLSPDSGIMLFMRNVFKVDDPYTALSTFSIGLGLKQQPAGTYTAKDIKGTYFMSAFGNDFVTLRSRVKYLSASGSISFDGAGNATIALVDNSEGILSSDSTSYTYTVTPRLLSPFATTKTDVIDIYAPNDTTNPYATATIGEDGRVLTFNLNIATAEQAKSGRANANRLFGLALQEN
ncbi:MAG: NHL repeat-containing protein [Gammaproteobacteria bacterium]